MCGSTSVWLLLPLITRSRPTAPELHVGDGAGTSTKPLLAWEGRRGGHVGWSVARVEPRVRQQRCTLTRGWVAVVLQNQNKCFTKTLLVSTVTWL